VFACGPGSTVTWMLGDLAPGASTMRALDLKVQPAVPGGVLVFTSARASATNAEFVRVDRSLRVCTVPVCEPLPPTRTPTVTPTPPPTDTPTLTPTTARAVCTGDCDDSGEVVVNELVTLVNIALGNAQPSACPHGIPSGADVNIALLVKAVNNALNGCAG